MLCKLIASYTVQHFCIYTFTYTVDIRFNYGVLCSALFRPIAYLVIVFGGNWGGLLIEWFSTRHATAQRAREDGKSTHCARYVLPRECCSWPSYLQTSMDPFGGRKTTCTCRYRIRWCQQSKGSCSSNMWHCSQPRQSLPLSKNHWCRSSWA